MAGGLSTGPPAETLCCGGSVGIHREFGKDQRRSVCRREEEEEEQGYQRGSFSSPSQAQEVRGRREMGDLVVRDQSSVTANFENSNFGSAARP